MMSDDKVGGWVKKGQNHEDVILECPLRHFSIMPLIIRTIMAIWVVKFTEEGGVNFWIYFMYFANRHTFESSKIEHQSRK